MHDVPLEQSHVVDTFVQVVLLYLRQAIASDRSTVAGLLEKQGHCKMAEIIRRL